MRQERTKFPSALVGLDGSGQLPGRYRLASHLQQEGVAIEAALQVLGLQVLGAQRLYDDLVASVAPGHANVCTCSATLTNTNRHICGAA